MESSLVRQIDSYLLNEVLVPGTVRRLVLEHRDVPLERLFETVREVLCYSVLTWLELYAPFRAPCALNDRRGELLVQRDAVRLLAGLEGDLDLHLVMHHVDGSLSPL